MSAAGSDLRDRAAPRAGASQIVLCKGRYVVTRACTPREIARAQALRAMCFSKTAPDRDAWDDMCQHYLVSDLRDDRLVCCFRVRLLTPLEARRDSYSAQFYDLTALAAYPGPTVELGRFCVHPEVADPDVLRVAWGALAVLVDARGVRLLFGCSSFSGVDPAPYRACFTLLSQQHLAPARWRPTRAAAEVVALGDGADVALDRAKALSRMPPLLRSYLSMGGWVSDHAVVDRDMNTLHVFTGVEIDAIPPARKSLLRRVAASDGRLRRVYSGKDDAVR